MTEAFVRTDLASLAAAIKSWGVALGFQAVGIADADLGEAEARLAEWLARGFHGEMDYMARHGAKRAQPAALVPGTLRVISARMDYQPAAADARAGPPKMRSKAACAKATCSRTFSSGQRSKRSCHPTWSQAWTPTSCPASATERISFAQRSPMSGDGSSVP